MTAKVKSQHDDGKIAGRLTDWFTCMFKMIDGTVPATNADQYFILQRAKRHINGSGILLFWSTVVYLV